MAKQDDYVRYTIRVPADLYARLQEAAGAKSVNAEIVVRLEQSFQAPSVQQTIDDQLGMMIDYKGAVAANSSLSATINVLKYLLGLVVENKGEVSEETFDVISMFYFSLGGKINVPFEDVLAEAKVAALGLADFRADPLGDFPKAVAEKLAAIPSVQKRLPGAARTEAQPESGTTKTRRHK